MSVTPDEFLDTLSHVVRQRLDSGAVVENLHRLSGGASQETWSFDRVKGISRERTILRRTPGGAAVSRKEGINLDPAGESRLMQLAASHGVPAPKVLYTLDASDGLGGGFLMEFIAGETIPQKILRNDDLRGARSKMAGQCGKILAKIHAIPNEELPPLANMPARELWQYYRDLYDRYERANPVFEAAFCWLEDRLRDSPRLTLVHGDFRNGNFIVGDEGIRAVLDWELAHVGDPMEDLGWICVNSWRFGNVELPVGGFGSREEVYEAYERAGGKVDRERAHYWEVFGTLKWGIACMTMVHVYETGLDRSVERAAIGRRVSETEIDLLRLMEVGGNV